MISVIVYMSCTVLLTVNPGFWHVRERLLFSSLATVVMVGGVGGVCGGGGQRALVPPAAAFNSLF